ncbi:hypothetical protein C8J57DRAFT_1070971 [Mycena rebaudengoi]|nr:hypothetical protein C8J57DRAFT_1070971 [Mycena rebaudengoi]
MAAATIDFKKKPADLSTFKEALEKAPKNILAKSILEASKKDGHVAKIFWDALVATETGNKKGAKARFETCRHCKEGFDVTNNTDKSCVWHHGNLIIDEEVWNEYSEIDEGPTDSKENRRERPQGFFWDCCGLQLNSEGCLSTKHAAAAVLKRNSKILPELQPERKAQYADSIDEPHDATEPPSKKRKVDADVTIKCRKCGEMYNELKNKKKLCHWHDGTNVDICFMDQEPTMFLCSRSQTHRHT